MGLDEEKLAVELLQTPHADWQQKTVATMVEGLGGHDPVDPHAPLGAADFVAGDPGDTLGNSTPGGSKRWRTSRDSMVVEGLTTAMSPRT